MPEYWRYLVFHENLQLMLMKGSRVSTSCDSCLDLKADVIILVLFRYSEKLNGLLTQDNSPGDLDSAHLSLQESRRRFLLPPQPCVPSSILDYLCAGGGG